MSRRKFTWDDKGFLLDDERHQLISGSICYFRMLPDQWEDRLAKLSALGANAVEVYVPWNFHEPQEGAWVFTGRADVKKFIQLADAQGLNVVLRPGPYICAEWEMGGLPWWLLAKEPAPRLRCSDPAFLKPVQAYFERLFEELAPLFCSRGGPIIAVQLENEYGYWGTDRSYLEWLRDLVRSLTASPPGPEPLLFTVDGCFTPETQRIGGLEGILRTASFGSRPEVRFGQLRQAQVQGPLVVMEFWVGWFTTWGGGMKAERDAADVAKELSRILEMGASVNIFVFAGGTSFGFSAGANLDAASGRLEPHVTSYDYDGLLMEDGQVTEKFHACRRAIQAHTSRPELAEPLPASLTAPSARFVCTVTLRETSPLLAQVPELASKKATSLPGPLSLEALGEGLGYAYYRYVGAPEALAALAGLPLQLHGVRDFALVLCDGKVVGSWDRNQVPPDIVLPDTVRRLEILVEVTARVNFGPAVAERKGLVVGVRAGMRPQDERELFGWECAALPMRSEKLAALKWDNDSCDCSAGPRFYRGTFSVQAEQLGDSFVSVPGFVRGFVTINGFNLGWHRREGPQLSLYLPRGLLRQGENELIVFELLGPPATQSPGWPPLALLEAVPRWGRDRRTAAKQQAREVVGFVRQVGLRRLCRLAGQELRCTNRSPMAAVLIAGALLMALLAVVVSTARAAFASATTHHL